MVAWHHPNSCPIWYLLTWLLPNFPSDYQTILKYLSSICYLLTWLPSNFPSDQLSTKAHVHKNYLVHILFLFFSSFFCWFSEYWFFGVLNFFLSWFFLVLIPLVFIFSNFLIFNFFYFLKILVLYFWLYLSFFCFNFL
jgi:hypothetical protein